MKKLAIVHPAYWEQAFGGAELQISYICAYAQSKNWEVHYIFEDKKTPIENIINIQLHPITPVIRRNTIGFRFALSRGKIEKVLDSINPDVIYSRCAFSWSGIVAKYAISKKKKHIWGIASDDDPIAYRFKKKDLLKPLNFLEKYWIKFAIKNASVIISQNKFQQSLLQNLHSRMSILISQMAPEETELVKKDFSKIKILWIANLKTIKRPEIFIRLSTHFINSNVEFIMIGKPDAKYDSLLSDAKNLNFKGSIPNKEVNKHLCQGHLLVNTSISEGFSNTFVQAWLRKVPVLSMNSNPDEILTSQNIGQICSTEEKLRNTVEFLISNPDQIQLMGDKAYDYAIKNHSIKNLLPKIHELF